VAVQVNLCLFRRRDERAGATVSPENSMSHKIIRDVDRIRSRHRPDSPPIMHQDWGKLHFMHWRVHQDLLRPKIHPDLDIDTYRGSAWMAITPFTMWDIRGLPELLPPIPGLSSMHELNVRTYVHLNGVPGVWFFSLDVDNAIATLGAKTLFQLPYHTAEIDLEERGETIEYELLRDEEPPVYFKAKFRKGKELPQSQVGSKEYFLTERYVLYTASHGALYQARIHHQHWPLRESRVEKFETNILDANGLPQPKDQPLVHYAEEVNVDIWPLQECSRLSH
jgi:uncharacterized protein YqjF (DUF2071 family)